MTQLFPDVGLDMVGAGFRDHSNNPKNDLLCGDLRPSHPCSLLPVRVVLVFIWYLSGRAERDPSSSVSSVAIYYVNRCKTLAGLAMNGPWKRLQKPKQSEGKISLRGKTPPAPVRRRGGRVHQRWLLSLSLPPSLSGWCSLFPQQLTHLSPGLAPELLSCLSPCFLLISARVMSHARPRSWQCQPICKKYQQDQTPFPGAITAVILVAVSVNKEKYSAALEHLIAGSQDVACTGFLL